MRRSDQPDSPARTALRWLLRLSGALAALLLAYIGAGTIGGLVPANGDWRPATRGVHVFIEDNGVHTDFVLPKRVGDVDLGDLGRARDLRDPRYAGHRYLVIGWGDRDFYENTPHWRDIKLSTVLNAAIGRGGTVLHVGHVPGPAPGARMLVLRPEEYRRLVAFIRAHQALDAAGRPDGRPAYGKSDSFYTASGHYSAIHTCNDWVGEGLRRAGVRVGRWTPFSFTVLWWFP